MATYYFRDIEVSRGDAVRIWRASDTYANARMREYIFPNAERGRNSEGEANHLAEAGLRIKQEPTP